MPNMECEQTSLLSGRTDSAIRAGFKSGSAPCCVTWEKTFYSSKSPDVEDESHDSQRGLGSGLN